MTAPEMSRLFKDAIIREWCKDALNTDEEKDAWLRAQSWYNARGSQYCQLFEKFEPKETGRQRFIETVIEGRSPSFGYVVLANLMASKFVNTIITTNFDDLVYASCISYTGIRPVVYAYGLLASEMRITIDRPKILKLHGDYLYSELKNTDREVASQDPNMASHVSQLLNEYGLIVIGYGGGDRSVMKVLSQISPKNDLYWCILRGTEPNRSVKKLLSDKKGFLVEIDGFDEMMSEVREVVGFDVTKMLGSIQETQDQIVNKLKSFAAKYSADILSEVVVALRHQAEESKRQISKLEALDSFTKGSKALAKRDLVLSEEYFRKAIEFAPNDVNAHNNLGVTLLRKSNYVEAETCFRRATELDGDHVIALSNLGLALIRNDQHEEAERILQKAIGIEPKSNAVAYLAALFRFLHRYEEALSVVQKGLEVQPQNAQLLISAVAVQKALKNEQVARECAEQVRALLKPEESYNRACLEAVAGNTTEALNQLEAAAQTTSFNKDWANFDPDFDNIRDQPRFRSLTRLSNRELV